jgi:hypothetical protein
MNRKKSGMMFFDLAEPSQIIEVVEPLFMKLNADVEIIPVMNGDDLRKRTYEIEPSLIPARLPAIAPVSRPGLLHLKFAITIFFGAFFSGIGSLRNARYRPARSAAPRAMIATKNNKAPSSGPIDPIILICSSSRLNRTAPGVAP